MDVAAGGHEGTDLILCSCPIASFERCSSAFFTIGSTQSLQKQSIWHLGFKHAHALVHPSADSSELVLLAKCTPLATAEVHAS